MSFIEIKNVYKIFGKQPQKVLDRVKSGISKDALLSQTNHGLAINNMNLSIEKGEIFVIMGLSGSGKSTLVRHINRLIDPTAGEICIDGQNILNFNKEELLKFRRTTTSMVFQNFGLFAHKTVLENTAYGLEVSGIQKEERHSVARSWIEKVGLSGYEESYPRELSGGMQQRVGLARALATDPEILLMDEPFSALDPIIKREMQDVLQGLQKDLRKTVIFITHDLDEALRLGNRIAIMKDGQLVQVGTPDDIKNNPATDYVRDFVNAVLH